MVGLAPHESCCAKQVHEIVFPESDSSSYNLFKDVTMLHASEVRSSIVLPYAQVECGHEPVSGFPSMVAVLRSVSNLRSVILEEYGHAIRGASSCADRRRCGVWTTCSALKRRTGQPWSSTTSPGYGGSKACCSLAFAMLTAAASEATEACALGCRHLCGYVPQTASPLAPEAVARKLPY